MIVCVCLQISLLYVCFFFVRFFLTFIKKSFLCLLLWKFLFFSFAFCCIVCLQFRSLCLLHTFVFFFHLFSVLFHYSPHNVIVCCVVFSALFCYYIQIIEIFLSFFLIFCFLQIRFDNLFYRLRHNYIHLWVCLVFVSFAVKKFVLPCATQSRLPL